MAIMVLMLCAVSLPVSLLMAPGLTLGCLWIEILLGSGQLIIFSSKVQNLCYLKNILAKGTSYAFLSVLPIDSWGFRLSIRPSHS